jgi:hypothetical protein
MDKTTKKDDRGGLIIGGCLLIGMGVGFFFLKQSALAFVACMFIGLGLGLVISTFISRRNE